MAKKKGNISIIIIFILALVSLLGLLSARYIRDIVHSTGQLHDFYRSHYLSKAGIEIGLTIVDNHDIGFEGNISSQNNINENFKCYPNCTISSEIKSLVHYDKDNKSYLTSNQETSTCDQENAITIAPQEIYNIPLFYDKSSISGSIDLQSVLSTDLNIELEIISNNTDIGIGISLGDGGQNLVNRHSLYMSGEWPTITINNFLQNINVKETFTGDTISSNQLIYTFGNQVGVVWPIAQTFHNFNNYLLISNESSNNQEDLQFCVEIKNKNSSLPQGRSTIQSEGKFRSYTTNLRATKTSQIPDFLFNTYIQN